MIESQAPNPVPQDVEVRPVPSKAAVEAATNSPRGKAREMAQAMKDLSIDTVDKVAGKDIPAGMKDNLMIALFGNKDASAIKDKTLAPLAQGLDQILNKLTSNLDASATTTADLDIAIKAVIEQTAGWNDMFRTLGTTQQTEVIEAIKKMGAASFARRIMMEKVVISAESGNYAAARRKFETIESQLKTRNTEKRKVDSQVAAAGGDRAKISADKSSREREVNNLKSQKEAKTNERENLLQRMAEREEIYLRKRGVNLADELKKDKSFQDWKRKAEQLQNDISDPSTGLNKKIADAESNLKDVEEKLEYFNRADLLTTEIEDLSVKLSEAEGELITSRTAFAEKLNGLMKDLNGVLPEGAKEALNKYKQRIEEANREKTINDATNKAEKAKKDGDMKELAKSELIKALELRYVKTETQRRMADFWAKRDVQVTDIVKLKTEYEQLFGGTGRGSATLTEAIMNLGSTPPGANSGLSPDVAKYLADNPDLARKVVEETRIDVFKSVAKQAVLRLDLPETSLRSLANSPDFLVAAKDAIAANSEIEKNIELVYGAKLGGSRNIAETIKKLPLGGLLGIIMMIFGLGFKGLFTAGKTV